LHNVFLKHFCLRRLDTPTLAAEIKQQPIARTVATVMESWKLVVDVGNCIWPTSVLER